MRNDIDWRSLLQFLAGGEAYPVGSGSPICRASARPAARADIGQRSMSFGEIGETAARHRAYHI